LHAFLRPFALEMGVVDAAQIRAASAEAWRMLRRLRAHPLWAELDAAQRWHELPFSILEGERAVHGVIDLVYRAGDGWRIVEFKTDELRPGADLGQHIRTMGYDAQVQRYVRALRRQLGAEVEALLVFLNAGRQVVVVRGA
jgi:ATP-dependent exoDNAse (exonuclease V) beta subunit